MSVGGDTYLPITENRNIVKLVNATTGLIDAEYEYSPFGVLLSETGVAVDVSPYRYKTEYLDKESGLYYFGYRFYDPVNGRWLSREPLGEGASLNLYMYCQNDPINRYDVLGLNDDLTDKLKKNEKYQNAALEVAYYELIKYELMIGLVEERAELIKEREQIDIKFREDNFSTINERIQASQKNIRIGNRLVDLARAQVIIEAEISAFESEAIGIITSQSRFERDTIMLDSGMSGPNIFLQDRLNNFGLTTVVDHMVGTDLAGSNVEGNHELGIAMGFAELGMWVLPFRIKGFNGIKSLKGSVSFGKNTLVNYKLALSSSKVYTKMISEIKGLNFANLKGNITILKQEIVNSLKLKPDLASTNGVVFNMADDAIRPVVGNGGGSGGGKRYLYRYINAEDLKNIQAGKDIVAEGTGYDVAAHVSSGDTGLISATMGTADDIAKFKNGSFGLIRIDLDILKAKGVGIIDHKNVIQLIKNRVEKDFLKSAINAKEVLIKNNIPYDAIELIK